MRVGVLELQRLCFVCVTYGDASGDKAWYANCIALKEDKMSNRESGSSFETEATS